MKSTFSWILIFASYCVLAQHSHQKKVEVLTNEIEFSTEGLDEIKLSSSEGDWLEVNVFEESPNANAVTLQFKSDFVSVSFKPQFNQESEVFRKFITKRLNRAYAEVKVPKNKLIRVLGTNVDVITNNYEGDLEIYIDKGLVNLNQVKGNVEAKLFQGNVYAGVKNTKINVVSNNGKILVNGKKHQKSYNNQPSNTTKKFTLTSINANVVLTTQ
jgi:hypothetical protein